MYKAVMAMNPKDARLRELQFLAKLDREGRVEMTVAVEDPDRLMILHLLREGYVNDLAALSGTSGNINNLEGALQNRLTQDLNLLLRLEPVALRINHKGRVRLAELEQALQTGRDRDPTNTVISKRHLDRDLIIAIVSAHADSPVSLAMLDMNGLKQINDNIDHAAGDEAIETYLKTIAMFLGDDAEGYRGEGGDELVIVMRGTALPEATKIMRQALTQLTKEKVRGVPFLSASCGVTSTVDPNTDAKDLLKRVDAIQYRAKGESKKRNPRPSALAVNDEPVEVLPDPVPGLLQYALEKMAKGKA
jgi:diguanylate cyclase (GGDEF)-like protein